MELLKELFRISTQLDEKKKETITVPTLKPRAKHLNDILRSKKGGRHRAATDYDRNAAKRETRKSMYDKEMND